MKKSVSDINKKSTAMQKKQPYSNGISDLFIFILLISLLVACSSCAATKKDCRGVKHTYQKGGFYL